jgi:hypothetical protein
MKIGGGHVTLNNYPYHICNDLLACQKLILLPNGHYYFKKLLFLDFGLIKLKDYTSFGNIRIYHIQILPKGQ